MKDQASVSLELARLQHRLGDLREARMAAEEALKEAHKLENNLQWLEAARLIFQCSYELDELSYSHVVIAQVMQLHRDSECEKNQAQAENLIASWLLVNRKFPEAETYLDSAIAKSTQNHDLDALARSLLTLSLLKASKPGNYGQCLLALEKLDIITQELENPEISLTANLLRAYIYTQTEKFDQAQEILWQAYEAAKIHGYNLLVSAILIQMARVHRDQGQQEQFQIYAQLALRGTDKNKLPRLYRTIKKTCPEDIQSCQPQADLILDEVSRLVHERQMGTLDFKNQHILFDLAVLFIKNPGQRYTKEELIERIWQQVYDAKLHDNLIYVSIKRLRSLMEPDLASPVYILRDRRGYYFNPQIPVQFKKTEEATL